MNRQAMRAQVPYFGGVCSLIVVNLAEKVL